MNTRDYLMRAYSQDHAFTREEFLEYVSEVFGKGFLYDLHRYMIDKYDTPKLGTGRVSYISKSVVFKVPIDQMGFRVNDWEGSLCSVERIPLARSRLLIIREIPVVVMEKVRETGLQEIEEKLGSVPSFVDWVDMGQVGFNRKGELVVYDYGNL